MDTDHADGSRRFSSRAAAEEACQRSESHGATATRHRLRGCVLGSPRRLHEQLTPEGKPGAVLDGTALVGTRFAVTWSVGLVGFALKGFEARSHKDPSSAGARADDLHRDHAAVKCGGSFDVRVGTSTGARAERPVVMQLGQRAVNVLVTHPTAFSSCRLRFLGCASARTTRAWSLGRTTANPGSSTASRWRATTARHRGLDGRGRARGHDDDERDVDDPRGVRREHAPAEPQGRRERPRAR